MLNKNSKFGISSNNFNWRMKKKAHNQNFTLHFHIDILSQHNEVFQRIKLGED